jgi:hypothetical protein
MAGLDPAIQSPTLAACSAGLSIQTLHADAIRRETSLKRWKREWKLALIEKVNPTWSDLLENWDR